MKPRSALALVLVLPVLGDTSVPGQVDWTQLTAPTGPPGRNPAMAYDSARGVVVMFGGDLRNDTWEWDGTQWNERTPAVRPPARSLHAMAYDSARGVVVVFGGTDGVSTLDDTWEWDGSTWTERQPANAPPPRALHAMAYDAARAQVVLFGGGTSSAATADTWVWNGVDWTQLAPAQSPPNRGSSAMAYDSVRQRVVLFGGLNFTHLDDTWEWNGTNWIQREVIGPFKAYDHAMVFDAVRGRVLLLAGRRSNAAPPAWEWDGVVWTQVAAATPPGRQSHAMAYDSARQRTVLFGGWNGLGVGRYDDTWEWDRTSWTERTSRDQPEPRLAHGFAFDSTRGTGLLFGGWGGGSAALGDTWSWNGAAWTQLSPAVSPPARVGHSMVYDPARDRVVLFGGGPFLSSLSTFDDTWEWDGTTWQQMNPATKPAARQYGAMFFDAERSTVVVHGGEWFFNEIQFSDTWEWNGVTWTLLDQGTRAIERARHAVAYDPKRGRAVMHGGWWEDDFGEVWVYFDDTWEWNGSGWSLLATEERPPARIDAGMAYDVLRDRIVMHGGSSPSSGLADTWELDDDRWVLRQQSAATGNVAQHTLVWDSAASHALMYGGVAGQFFARGDTWAYGTSAPASFTPFGVGCAGSTGVPMLAPAAGSLPWVGSTFTLQLQSAGVELASVLILGGSNTQWMGLPLPYSLAPLQMPNCTLYVSMDAMILATSLNPPRWVLPIPNEPAFVGGSVHAQGVVLDPLAQPPGPVWSNAGTAVLGAR